MTASNSEPIPVLVAGIGGDYGEQIVKALRLGKLRWGTTPYGAWPYITTPNSPFIRYRD